MNDDGCVDRDGPFYTLWHVMTALHQSDQCCKCYTNQKRLFAKCCTNHRMFTILHMHRSQSTSHFHSPIPSLHPLISILFCPSLSVYHVDAFLNNLHPLQASLLLLMMSLDPLLMWTSNITCTIKTTILVFGDKFEFILEDACNVPYSTRQSREVDRQSG